MERILKFLLKRTLGKYLLNSLHLENINLENRLLTLTNLLLNPAVTSPPRPNLPSKTGIKRPAPQQPRNPKKGSRF